MNEKVQILHTVLLLNERRELNKFNAFHKNYVFIFIVYKNKLIL